MKLINKLWARELLKGAILQTGRYNEILEKRGSQGALCGMDAEFIKKVFEAIHEESVRQQMEIINK